MRLWVGGRWIDAPGATVIRSPWDGAEVARAPLAGAAEMEAALAATAAAFEKSRRLSRHARARLLLGIAEGISARRRELVERLVREAGKPVALSEAEVSRAVVTFALAAEEAKRLGGEVIPLDVEASGRAYAPAISHFVPRGPVLGITPFNFPLNLVAHKVAPALAVGATVILKPPPQAPGAALLLAEIFEKAALEASDARETVPLGALQVMPCSNEVTEIAVRDPRVSIVSFTGSARVGWHLQQLAVGKKVVLELGGNAPVIVHEDADLSRAAARCAWGAFAYAGQVCISVQRVLVHAPARGRFTELFLEEIARLGKGDPALPETVVGPLIDSAAADRVMGWIDEARAGGARVLVGGNRRGALIEPTVLTDTRPEMKVACEEVFGPVALIEEYARFEDAIAAANRSRFGLQAGIFTDSARRVREAVETLDYGGILVNDVPTYRADNMPYGGLRESGLGREGVRYAMESYCERRTVVSWVG